MRYRTTAVQNEKYCALTINANCRYSFNITRGEKKHISQNDQMKTMVNLKITINKPCNLQANVQYLDIQSLLAVGGVGVPPRAVIVMEELSCRTEMRSDFTCLLSSIHS